MKSWEHFNWHEHVPSAAVMGCARVPSLLAEVEKGSFGVFGCLSKAKGTTCRLLRFKNWVCLFVFVAEEPLG